MTKSQVRYKLVQYYAKQAGTYQESNEGTPLATVHCESLYHRIMYFPHIYVCTSRSIWHHTFNHRTGTTGIKLLDDLPKSEISVSERPDSAPHTSEITNAPNYQMTTCHKSPVLIPHQTDPLWLLVGPLTPWAIGTCLLPIG